MDQLFDSDETRGGLPPPDPAAPLAARMRPRAFDEFVGQDRLLAAGSALRRALEDGHPHSMILHGPPGTGKTTLARLVAEASDAAFEEESAVQAGRAEVRAVLERARQRLRSGGKRTVFFLDEIHRFNKAQQDALLPAVEEGLVTLIGATTENPYFEVNSALISRTRVYELDALSTQDIAVLLQRAIARGECGEGATIAPEALEFLAERSAGDARIALNALELACESADGGEVTLAQAEDALQRRAILYDRQADRHYDTISAWIKATRGSDPDASLYYLAVMLEGGEDPRFIVRRMVVLASEDIGNADPQALVVAYRSRVGGGACGAARMPVRAGPGGYLFIPGAEIRRRQTRRVRRAGTHSRARSFRTTGPPALLHPQRRWLRQPPSASRTHITSGAVAGFRHRTALLRSG